MAIGLLKVFGSVSEKLIQIPTIEGISNKMSNESIKQSDEFLKISDQFQLGVLVTESPHPVTTELSQVAGKSISDALRLLFEVDDDVVNKYREFARSGRARKIADVVLKSLRGGGKIFFTGCGSTGRLSIQLASIWRDFWQKQRARGLQCSPSTEEWENRAFSVMAGGDFALIKSVEGFEDFTEFGKKQIGDMGVKEGDVVFAITEGGETSFVIGTAWKGLERGAKVYFVYNNPDSVLCEHVKRSREVIEEERIEDINLTTGPMAVTGSTRMQATSIQFCVLNTVMEMVVRDIMVEIGESKLDSNTVPEEFISRLEEMHSTLLSKPLCDDLARLVALEETVYRTDHKNNYFADKVGVDVFTDTAERSPTFCTPPFRKFDDTTAAESWAFLYLPYERSEDAWRWIYKREPNCVEWSGDEVRSLVGEDKFDSTYEVVKKISRGELMRFKIGLDGIQYRSPNPGDGAIGILTDEEKDSLISPNGFYRVQLETARKSRARTGVLFFGNDESIAEVKSFVEDWNPECVAVLAKVPRTDFLLDGITRIGVKMLMNAFSTCTMVRLGRVMGNVMVWLVPSNLKLIDRSTRYISLLTGMPYLDANRLLFEVIEYIEPRMKADQAYPPAVAMAVTRAKYGLSNEEAEKKLEEEMG